MTIVEQLRSGAFEARMTLAKQIFYDLERALGNLVFRRFPPSLAEPRLLNLGCGNLRYPGWVNADEFGIKRSLREKQFRPDWRLDLTRPWKCQGNYWDGIFTQHVLEHLCYSDVIHVLEECYRTLKPGAWLRISVPGLDRYLEFFQRGSDSNFFRGFGNKALAVAFLAQMHFHKSVWDAELMTGVLSELGFVNVRTVDGRAGTDRRLVKDQDEKRDESLVVEAQKPTAGTD